MTNDFFLPPLWSELVRKSYKGIKIKSHSKMRLALHHYRGKWWEWRHYQGLVVKTCVSIHVAKSFLDWGLPRALRHADWSKQDCQIDSHVLIVTRHHHGLTNRIPRPVTQMALLTVKMDNIPLIKSHGILRVFRGWLKEISSRGALYQTSYKETVTSV